MRMTAKKMIVSFILLLWMQGGVSASIHNLSDIYTTRLSMPFLANQGILSNDNILYYAKTFAGTVQIHKNGDMVLCAQSTGQRIVERISRGNPFIPKPGTRSQTSINFFYPHTIINQKTKVDAYNHILMPDIYPHISMKLKAYGRTVEKIFIVNPGGQPDQIKIGVDGTHELKINSDGQLTLYPQGIRYSTPKAYQMIDNQPVSVNVRYCMVNETTYGFQVDSYNTDYPLIIDPFIAGTFFGGENEDEIADLAVAPNGDIYVAGTTRSANIPVTTVTGGYLNSFDPIDHKEDIFIARFNSDLSTLLSATFIGGHEPDSAKSIVIDSSNNVIVCGQSLSSDFPGALGYKGKGDVIVFQMNSDLSTLMASKFYGGTEQDMPEDMIIYPDSNEIYIAGYTQSDDLVGTINTTFNGSTDAFVARFNNDLSSIQSTIYIGGTNSDQAFALQIYKSGVFKFIIVGGQTQSNDFYANSYDTTHNGDMDGFVCKVSLDLSSVNYATFLGGNEIDTVYAIVVDRFNQIYVTGTTSSENFPIETSQAIFDNTLNGTDIFVAKFSEYLENLESSTFIGGKNWESATDIIINDNKEIMIAGITASRDFPATPGSYDQNHNGAVDAFIATLSPDLSELSAATYLGGTADDRISHIAIHGANIAIAGTTWSSDYYISNQAFDATFSNREGFITILSQDLGGTLRILSESDSIHVTMSEDAHPDPFHLILTAENDLSEVINWQITTQAANGTALTSPVVGTVNAITYTPNENFYGTDSFVVEINDGGQNSDKVTVYVHVLPQPDYPVFTEPGQTFSVKENSPKGYTFGKIKATDPDNYSPTYSIVSNNESEPFGIHPQTGVLFVNNTSLVNYESYSPDYKIAVEIAIANNSNTTSATFDVFLINLNDAPTIIKLQEFEVLENSPVGTSLGTVVAEDEDQDVLSYQIISGNINSTFSILSNTGELFVINNEKLNFEGELKSFDLEIEVSDAAYTAAEIISVMITGANDPPVIQDQSFNTNENDKTSKFQVQANDADNNSLTYSILSGNNGGAFSIDAQTGLITVQNYSQLDYELYHDFSLTIAVHDGEYTETAIVQISLNNTNDNSPIIDDQTFQIHENSGGGTTVGTVIATDPDELHLTFQISDPPDNPFLISPSSGTLKVNSGSILDCETICAYTITVTVSDGINTSSGLVTVELIDINENPPRFAQNTFSFSVKENSPANTLVGQATAMDDDPADTLTYAITSGNSDNIFLMDTQTGNITVHAGAVLDREKVRSYVLGLQVSDGINFDTANAEVIIENLNDNPPVIVNQTWNVHENTPEGTIVGTVLVNDPDDDTQSLSIQSGNTNLAFSIIESNGNIMVRKADELDYELGPGKFILTIITSDGIYSDEGIITINITNTNDNPPLVKDQIFDVDENKRDNTWIGTVVANDDDSTDMINYEIIFGNIDNAFKIDRQTGKLSVNGDRKLNYENINQYHLWVQVSDGTNPVTATVIVNVNDKNDPPTVNNQVFSVEENLDNDTVIGTVSAKDDDDVDLRFSYEAVYENPPILIDPQGNIIIKDKARVDYETLKTVSLVVIVFDGEAEARATITVNITDVNDPPFITEQTFNIDEDSINTAYVGEVVATDEDRPMNILTYDILGGNDNNAFVIHESTGVIRVNKTSFIDFEKQDQYILTVQVDDGQARRAANITINIRNTNDNPPQAEDLSVTIDENLPDGYAIGHVVATDADNDVLNYRIRSDSNPKSVFTFSNANSGTITVQYGNHLDFEDVNEYHLIVEISDSYYQTTASVMVTVNNLNDNVPTIENKTFTVNENVNEGYYLGKVSAQDKDDDSLFYNIVQAFPSCPFMITPTTGEIYVNDTLDYESIQTYTLTVMVSDGLYTATSAIKVYINGINDNAPLVYNQTFTIKEDASNGDVVGQLVARDIDNDNIQFYFINPHNVFAIHPGSGIITVIDKDTLRMDDETQYQIDVKVEDNQFPSYALLTIEEIDGNDDRVVFDQTFSVQENSPYNTKLGIISVDAPPGTRQFMIVSGNSNDAFTLNPDTGLLTVNKPSELDYEVNDVYILKVVATINDVVNNPTLTIHIKDANEYPPVFGSEVYHFFVDENSNPGTPIGIIDAHDKDTDDILRYQIDYGAPYNPLVLDQETGQLTVDHRLDYEHISAYTLTVSVRDGKYIAETQVFLSVNDRNEDPPTFISDSYAFTIAEDAAPDNYIGEVLATDKDQGSTLIYQITAGNDQKIFQIDNTGRFSIDDADGLDFETQSAYTLTVQVSDGLYNDTALIFVSIKDTNDPPEIILSLYPRMPAIRGGSLHSVVLDNSGQVYTFGQNAHGQLGDDMTSDQLIPVPIYGTHDFVRIDSKYLHTIALQNDGSVWTWGWNQKGQLGNGATNDLSAPTRVEGLTRVKGIAAGAYHTMVLMHDGNVNVWGSNSYGQLGDGTSIASYTPVPVNSLEKVKAIAAGHNHSLAILNDNTVMAWGHNNAGQVGNYKDQNNNLAPVLSPVKVPNLVNVVSIAAGKEHSMALKQNGTVWTWGANDKGQLGIGSTINQSNPVAVKKSSSEILTDIVAIAAGGQHSLALQDNGTIWTWGHNNQGQLGNGTMLTDEDINYIATPIASDEKFIAIAAGENHSMALSDDGTVWSWGDNSKGQLGNNSFNKALEPQHVHSRDLFKDDPLNIGYQEPPKITILEDNQSDYLLFEIRDAETPAQNLSVYADADDPVLVPMDQINIECTDGQCKALITPSQNDIGETLIHFRVNDGEKSTIADIKLVVEEVNDPPMISEIDDQRTDENITISAIPFKIDDLESNADNLIITVRSSNLTLVPEDQIVFGGTGKNRSVTITPAINQSGKAVLTLTVRDKEGEANSQSFTLTVNAAPDITDIGDMTIAEDQSTDFIHFEISDAESDFTELTIVGRSSNQNLVLDENIHVTCSSIDCSMLIQPNPDQSGETRITLQVTDGHAISEDTFLLTIKPGNDPPVVVIENLAAGNPAIAAGAYHSLAVRGGNEVMSWGRNDMGQLGIGVSGADKEVLFPHIVSGLEKIVDLAAGENHSLALSNDGNVWAWGNNSHGQLGIGRNDITQIDTPQNVLLLTDIIAIEAGYAHTLALQDNGNVWIWGSNTNGQLGNGKTGQETSEYKPYLIQTLDNCVAIAAGYAHSVALKNDGTVWTWGFNSVGQLGNQTDTDKNVPVIVPGLANIIAIAAGDYHTVALKNDGTVWTWGDNPFGQLGDGTKLMKNSPVRVLDISNVIGISAGYVHTLALRNDGSVWGWGGNFYGQLGDNSDEEMQIRPVKTDITSSSAIRVEAGHYHSLVLNEDGSVFSFGNNGFGQLGINSVQGTVLPMQVKSPDNLGNLNIGTPYTIDEDGQTDVISFSVSDEETPSDELIVSISSSNPRLVDDSGFIKEGSGEKQQLTIRPSKNQFGRTTISIKVSDGISFSTESFTLWVNEINDSPIISDIGYQSIDEDTPSTNIPFQISDLETPADQLLVSATSANATLVPNANIQLSGTGQNRIALITPAKDMYGIATITIEVSDGVAAVSDTFTVRVKDVNDPPQISQIVDQTTDEDTPAGEISFTISDMETPASNLIVSGSTSDPSKVPESNLTFSGTDQNRNVTILPLLDQNGTVQITIMVSDGNLSSQESFNLNIVPVDDAPRISSIENQETWEYVSIIPIAFTVTDAETHSNDLIISAVSSDTLIVSNDNISFGGSGSERTILLEPSEDQFGTTDITIAVSDGNNTEMETFSLTVNPQRDWSKNEDFVNYSDLEDIWGRSANDIFAVGNGSSIFHFNGISWNKILLTYDYNFKAVWGDVGMVYVVGNNGSILQYNGHNWTKMYTGSNEDLNGIWGNGRSVFAVGEKGTILKFNGVSWTNMASGTTTTLLDIWGNDNKMYAVGNGGEVLVYNGFVWDKMPTVTAYSLRGVWGSSENDVFAVGDGGTIIHYNGSEWIEQERGKFSSLKGIWGLSNNIVFAAGLQGTIVSYNDNKWSETESGLAYPLMGIWGASITDIYVVGENGTILKRSTGQISGKITTSITGGNAILVGASVSIVETGQHTTTDENGRYVFDNVPIGAYTVNVSSAHFEPVTIPDIRVPGGEIAIPDINLSDLKTGVYSQAELDNAVYQERIKYDPDGDGVISTENVIYFLQWLGGF